MKEGVHIHTPFGDIEILLDDKPITYSVVEKEKNTNYSDVLGCYRIIVEFVPDGKSHEIKCIIPNMIYSERGPESGEDIECQAFYNEKGEKMSICLKAETGYLPDGQRWSDKYDYDADYLDNGMSYKILANTVENKFVFGIAWIDKLVDETGEEDHDRDIQTWFAADFTLDS